MLSGQKGNNGMGTDTEVVGGEASPEAGDTFTSNRLGDAVTHIFVGHGTISEGFLFLHLGLDVVERQ